uniref:Pentatricopeptide repeat-containing protein n=1 Tax=Ananas comosus var. bracteatus TaxID=296719 RepID=A0A6V7QE42_ANACO|nr:unnamed protein product [Ananas comosus var. bracteatus]
MQTRATQKLLLKPPLTPFVVFFFSTLSDSKPHSHLPLSFVPILSLLSSSSSSDPAPFSASRPPRASSATTPPRAASSSPSSSTAPAPAPPRHILSFAATVFDSLPNPDAASWNAMIAAHASRRSPERALALYFRMRAGPAHPDALTFALLVKACILGPLGDPRGEFAAFGGVVHGQVIKCGVEDLLVVKNSLLKMYSDLGLLESTRQLFEISSVLDLISWNTLISAYGKNGDLGSAREMFDRMPERNLVSWSAMIDGYVTNSEFSEALRLFSVMQGEKVRPDVVTLVSVLKACSQLGALDQGRWIHLYVDRNGIARNGNVVLETALVDMYCKCGCIDEASKVFDSVRNGDVVLWNAMIGGLAMHGHGERALNLLRRMKEKKLSPNESTFIGVLSACSHAGRVKEGKEIFESMKEFGVSPQREHYGCLADLLCRAGLVEEAEEVLHQMPMEPHAAQWGALLSSCRTYNKLEVGERVGKRMIALEPFDGADMLC